MNKQIILFLSFLFLSFGALLLIPFSGRTQIADSSKRHIQLEGAANFRDLGGYATIDGRHVKWNTVFRSADISKVTDSDLRKMEDNHVGYVVDFRGVEESKKAPDRLPPGTDYILCPAGSDNNLNDWMKTLMTIKTTEGADSMMIAFYAKTEFLADRYKPFFEKLMVLPADRSILFHCTAGKDRTGIGAALLLYALGVPYETIRNDYTATNYYWKTEGDKMTRSMVQYMHMDEQVAKIIAAAKKEYLDATFAVIKQKYGSVDDFLKGPVGLDNKKRKELKDRFLE